MGPWLTWAAVLVSSAGWARAEPDLSCESTKSEFLPKTNTDSTALLQAAVNHTARARVEEYLPSASDSSDLQGWPKGRRGRRSHSQPYGSYGYDYNKPESTTSTTTTVETAAQGVEFSFVLQINASSLEEVLAAFQNQTAQEGFKQQFLAIFGSEFVESLDISFPTNISNTTSVSLAQRNQFLNVELLAINIKADVDARGVEEFAAHWRGVDATGNTINYLIDILDDYFPDVGDQVQDANIKLIFVEAGGIMEKFGEEWRLVYRQSRGYKFAKGQRTLNADNPAAANFADLDNLESLKSNGRYLFMMVWKDWGENIWVQSSNPVTSRGVTGWEAVNYRHQSTTYWWKPSGLMLSPGGRDGFSFLTTCDIVAAAGSEANPLDEEVCVVWSGTNYQPILPSPFPGKNVPAVELWVSTDNKAWVELGHAEALHEHSGRERPRMASCRGDANGYVWLFGGGTGGASYGADLWIYDPDATGDKWRKMTVTSSFKPRVRPWDSTYLVDAEDRSTPYLVHNQGTGMNIWGFDHDGGSSVNWWYKQFSFSGGNGSPIPVRTGFAAVYTPYGSMCSRCLFLYGGQPNNGESADNKMYRFEMIYITNFRSRGTMPFASRRDHAMVWAKELNQILVFGGVRLSDRAHLNDFWSYKDVPSRWEQGPTQSISAGNGPPAMSAPQAAWTGSELFVFTHERSSNGIWRWKPGSGSVGDFQGLPGSWDFLEAGAGGPAYGGGRWDYANGDPASWGGRIIHRAGSAVWSWRKKKLFMGFRTWVKRDWYSFDPSKV